MRISYYLVLADEVERIRRKENITFEEALKRVKDKYIEVNDGERFQRDMDTKEYLVKSRVEGD